MCHLLIFNQYFTCCPQQSLFESIKPDKFPIAHINLTVQGYRKNMADSFLPIGPLKSYTLVLCDEKVKVPKVLM